MCLKVNKKPNLNCVKWIQCSSVSVLNVYPVELYLSSLRSQARLD